MHKELSKGMGGDGVEITNIHINSQHICCRANWWSWGKMDGVKGYVEYQLVEGRRPKS